MTDYGLSDTQLRRLRHGSIYQTRRDHHGVQGGATYEPDTLLPGFNPDAAPLTEEWFDAKDAYWQKQRRKVREAGDE